MSKSRSLLLSALLISPSLQLIAAPVVQHDASMQMIVDNYQGLVSVPYCRHPSMSTGILYSMTRASWIKGCVTGRSDLCLWGGENPTAGGPGEVCYKPYCTMVEGAGQEHCRGEMDVTMVELSDSATPGIAAIHPTFRAYVDNANHSNQEVCAVPTSLQSKVLYQSVRWDSQRLGPDYWYRVSDPYVQESTGMPCVKASCSARTKGNFCTGYVVLTVDEYPL